jgi:hypothetical protein
VAWTTDIIEDFEDYTFVIKEPVIISIYSEQDEPVFLTLKEGKYEIKKI